MAYKNAVLDDPDVQSGLRHINPKFGDFCIRAAGKVWGLPLVSQKVKALITIAIDVVNQDHVGPGNPFGAHVNMALKQGSNRAEVEEVLLFTCVYAGFNKAAGAFGALNEILGPSPDPLDTRIDFDQATLDSSGLRANVNVVEDREFADLFYEIGSEAWALPILSTKDKSFLAIAIDIVNQNKAEGKINPFLVHVRIAAKQGASQAEIEEVVKFTCVYAGFSKGASYFTELKRAEAEGLLK